MSKVVIWETDKDGEGVPLKVGEFDDIYELYDFRLPVGHFASDVVLTFEEDSEGVNADRRKHKGWDDPVSSEE